MKQGLSLIAKIKKKEAQNYPRFLVDLLLTASNCQEVGISLFGIFSTRKSGKVSPQFKCPKHLKMVQHFVKKETALRQK